MDSAAAANTPIATHTRKCPHNNFKRMNLEGTLPVNKPMTKGDLKSFYNVSYKTFKKWVKPIIDKIDYNNKTMFFSRDLRVIRELFDGIPIEY